jgi:hypothetical protein
VSAPRSQANPPSREAAVQVERLLTFGTRVRRELALAAAGRLSRVVLACAGASLLLDRWLRFGSGTLGVLRLAGLVGLGLVAWRALGGLLRERPDVLGWASLIDRGTGGRPFLAPRFATLLQLQARTDRDDLAREAVKTSLLELADYDYGAHLDRETARRERKRLLGLWAVPLVFALFLPGSAWVWIQRWLLGIEANWPQETTLVIEGLAPDGSLVVPRGEPFELRVRAAEDSVVPDEVTLRYNAGDLGDRAVMIRFSANDFRLPMPGLAEDGRLWVRGGDARLGPIPLLVRERPRVLEAVLTARLASTGFEERETFRRQDRDLGFLEGCTLQLEARADQPLADLRISGGEALDLVPNGPDGPRFAVGWTHTRAASLRFEFVSAESGLASHPWALSIAMREDRAPRVTLARNGVRDRVTPEARVPVRLVAQDDFGLAGLRLDLAPGAWGVGEGELIWSETLLERQASEELDSAIELEREVLLAPLGLEVGQVVQLSATATDASHLGAQAGTSRPVVLRVVDPGYLMAEISARLQLARGRFRKAWEEARNVEDLLAKGEPLAGVPELLRRHRITDRTVWQTRRVLDDSLRELTLNALISEQAETLLRRRAMDPLELLADEWMRAQRADLEARIAGETVSVETLLSNQRVIAEDMKKVLDGMEQWDSFVDLVNHLNEIIRLEEQLRGETRGTR